MGGETLPSSLSRLSANALGVPDFDGRYSRASSVFNVLVQTRCRNDFWEMGFEPSQHRWQCFPGSAPRAFNDNEINKRHIFIEHIISYDGVVTHRKILSLEYVPERSSIYEWKPQMRSISLIKSHSESFFHCFQLRNLKSLTGWRGLQIIDWFTRRREFFDLQALGNVENERMNEWMKSSLNCNLVDPSDWIKTQPLLFHSIYRHHLSHFIHLSHINLPRLPVRWWKHVCC